MKLLAELKHNGTLKRLVRFVATSPHKGQRPSFNGSQTEAAAGERKAPVIDKASSFCSPGAKDLSAARPRRRK